MLKLPLHTGLVPFQRHLALCVAAVFFVSCQKQSDPAPGPHPYALPQPANFAAPAPGLPNNPLTHEGIELGKVLFYDSRLSGDNSLSCASCHDQTSAFADAGKAFSTGTASQLTLRNSPPLFNLAWQTSFFWDGGATDLESQAIGPLQAHNELNQNIGQLVTELQQTALYPPLFQKAFGSSQVTSQRLLFALAQFQKTLVSANSRYDKYRRNEPGGSLTGAELSGLHLFGSKCGSCHATDLFTDNGFHNNGLDAAFPADNEELAWGRGRITLNPADIGKFKTPSLRNVTLTAPYMHDGRFQTLEQVLEHYSSGVNSSETLSPLLQQNNQPGIALTAEEKTSILAFLGTLTDTEFTQNPAFANPNP